MHYDEVVAVVDTIEVDDHHEMDVCIMVDGSIRSFTKQKFASYKATECDADIAF